MLRMIIVENETLILQGLVETIDWISRGCIVVGTATNGKDGLTLIEDKHPDLVITDIRMPGMDGLTMVEKAIEAGHAFHTIFLTGFSDFDYAKKAIHLKASAYLLKPLDLEELDKELDDLRASSNAVRGASNLLEGLEVLQLSKTVENAYVQETLKKIIREYDQKLTIESIANELGLTPGYLGRLIKEETGSSFTELLNGHRVQVSKQLLEEGLLKLYEISNLTGFYDYKHFGVVFRKHEGMTPKEYQTMKRSR